MRKRLYTPCAVLGLSCVHNIVLGKNNHMAGLQIMGTNPYIPKLATMAHKILTFTCNSALRKCVHPLCCTKMSYLPESWLRPLVLSGDMLRNRGFILLTILNIINQISAEQISNSNGWIPMSHNDIYNQIRNTHHIIRSTEYPIYVTLKSAIKYDNNLEQRQIHTKKDLRDIKESVEVINEKPLDTFTVTEKTVNGNQVTLNNKENTRKAKKVWNRDIDFSIDNTLELPEIDLKTSVANEENSINDAKTDADTSNTYEVTEEIKEQLASEDNTSEYVGYQYNPPTEENQNLTSTFYKILSKYNIKSEDKLRNYDLSLQRKVQNPSSSAYRIPLPYGYNNLNHLPVDPLLAVFLSNYGFYLPSLYGIKANYNNLYGYLASNNIHNNKPFGLYKVFSDTDSWN